MREGLRERLDVELGRAGWLWRSCRIDRIAEAARELADRRRDGELDGELYQSYLADLAVSPQDGFQEAAAAIVVSVPQPQHLIGFTHHGASISLGVPPTYLHGRRSDERVQEAIENVLAAGGHRVVRGSLPKKLLAVRTGLARYGRNNITYVDRWGSYHRLAAFIADAPLPEHDWREPEVMAACEECGACWKACPTGAIAGDRFLIHAERCLTYLNEMPTPVAFPAWVDEDAHNQLVGCMRCHQVCPANRGLLEQREAGPVFNEAETEAIAADTPLDRLPESTVSKLREHDLTDLYEVLPRNVRVLLRS